MKPNLDIIIKLLSSFFKQLPRDSFTTKTDSSGSFNLFKALRIDSKEVLSCRFIGALLQLKDKDGENARQLFAKHVFGEEDTLEDASIYLEDYNISGEGKSGRADIVIYSKGCCYPIEAKIDAEDQEGQLKRYYEYYKKRGAKKVYYLTPTGREPSKKSIGQEECTKYKCVSYCENIHSWLEELEKRVTDSVKAVIIQYLEVIEDMCKDSKEQEKLFEVINLNKKERFSENEELVSLIKILNLNGDTNGLIQREIQRAYLRKRIDLPKGYDWKIPDQDEKDDHVRLYVVNEHDQIQAHICVDTNLYLTCKKRKENGTENWHEGEQWAYIGPDGIGAKFRLNDCKNIIDPKNERKIKIDSLLKEIEETYD